MAADFYDRMRGAATRLLDKFAQGTVTLTRQGTQTTGANPWDTPTTGEPATWTLDAAVKGVSKEFIDGVNIIATDREVLASVFADSPQPADVLTIDGKAVTVLKIMPIPAAGVPCAWKFIVRG